MYFNWFLITNALKHLYLVEKILSLDWVKWTLSEVLDRRNIDYIELQTPCLIYSIKQAWKYNFILRILHLWIIGCHSKEFKER